MNFPTLRNLFCDWSKNKISIVPKKHLVANIGFVKDATHTKIKYKDWFHELKTNELDITNLQPKLKTPDLNYDIWLSKNIFKVDKKLDNETEKMKEMSENTGNFITGMTDGVKGFMGGFSELYKKTDGTFDDLDNSLKDAKGELSKFENEAGELENFDLKNILTNLRSNRNSPKCLPEFFDGFNRLQEKLKKM